MTLLGVELRPLGRPDRSQSLYQLRYAGGSLDISQPYGPSRFHDLIADIKTRKLDFQTHKKHKLNLFMEINVYSECF
jgi:hypothetical protein